MAGLINEPLDGMVRTLLGEADGPLLIVGPSAAVIEALVEAAVDLEEPPEMRLLAHETTLKKVMRDFLVASNAADLVEEELLSIRTDQVHLGNELLITAGRLTALVSAGEETGALSTEAEEFVTGAYDYYLARWEEARPFSLRTPPLSRVRESLRANIGPGPEGDFNAILASLETARGDGDGLDEVTISLLVAAKNEELLYDISKWGEDVGIASKATFSRTKTTLEDLGLIDTEKVPIDVGRPRLRLKFANERLRTASDDELASVAQNLIG